ncbi:MAG TPA: hypothetical protein VN621_01995 [Arthrobacter sp.]|nr:hypothetical protein [Arthrobacter sp.]
MEDADQPLASGESGPSGDDGITTPSDPDPEALLDEEIAESSDHPVIF